MGLLLLVFAGALVSSPPVHAAERLVTLGGAITEIVFALDAGASVVATDASSTWPDAANALPKLGYYRTLAVEPLLALRPDLVLASEHAGPPAVLAQLETAGVRVVRIAERPDAAGLRAKIGQIAAALGRVPAGEALGTRISADLAAVREGRRSPERAPRVVFLLSAGPQGLMAAGDDTTADAVLGLLGAHNLFDGHRGYAPASAEALAGQSPDFVLVSARSLAALGGPAAITGLPAFAAAGLDAGRVIPVDDLATLGFGPRLPASLAALAERLAAAP
jgi:iron complex transport system substrate-binding protein